MPTKKKSSQKKSASKKKVTKKTTRKATKKAVKKTAKKVTKKSSRKTVAKKPAERVLVCANEDQCFWTNDGQILSDLRELSDALETMADEVFLHHVTKERNDFADWVEAVLADQECATALRRSRKPSSARTVVVRHLKAYTF